MPLKCCAPNCSSNYKTSNEKVSVYKFPKDEEEKEVWRKAIPRSNLEISKYTAVCRKHWPEDCKIIVVHGKPRPADPPTVFENIPKRCLSSPPPKARKTTKVSASARNTQQDELLQFEKLDQLEFEKIPSKMSKDVSVVVYQVNNKYHIQSKQFHEGVPEFCIVIQEDLSFKVFHYGVSCSVTSLIKNKINLCKTWSSLDEILRYVKSREREQKVNVLLNQLSVSGKKTVGKSIYPPEMISRAFEYFCISRSLYDRLCKDFQLPSIRTLTRITSKTSSLDDTDFAKGVLQSLPDWQKRYVLPTVQNILLFLCTV